MGKLLTRKQQWRRTRTRKHAWGDLPPEVLEAMLAACSGGMSKSLSWDQSYLSNMKLKPNETVEESTRRVSQQQEQQEPQHQNKQESTDATDSRAGAKSASGGVAPVLIPRSVSCSSLSTRRILFPRSSSRDELGEGSARRVSASQRRVLGRRGVSFDTQVKMVLIPKRDEFNETERGQLWWGREDYSQFRQVLIDWKRRNVHRLSHTDNILSIDLTDIDEEELMREETVSAADSTAAATAAASAAAAAAAAAAMAAATAASAAVATAAAAAAATAAEVAASHARDDSRILMPGQEICNGDAVDIAETLTKLVSVVPRTEEDTEEEGRDVVGPELSMRATAPSTLATTAAKVGQGGQSLGDITEVEEEGDEQQEDEPEGVKPASGGGHRAHISSSFTTGPRGGGGGGRAMPDWSTSSLSERKSPLRRAFSISEVNAHSTVARLNEVPLSEKQATVESLRAWRQNLDNLLARLSTDNSGERGRSVSLQQTKSAPRSASGRETAILALECDSDDNQDDSNIGTALCDISSYTKARNETAREPARPPSTRTGDGACEGKSTQPRVSPIIAAFERAREEELARQAEAEAERAANAAAMVEAAAAAAAAAVAAAAMAGEGDKMFPGQKGQEGENALSAQENANSGESLERREEEGTQVIQLGLNDSPESAAVAAAAGIRMAAEGVSNLSLRARDSVENLQEMAEHNWGQVPLSPSA